MKVILASQSPRRKEILKRMGVEFTSVVSGFDEYLNDKKSASEVACALALGKAESVAADNPDAVVIGADTIVVLDNRQLGKPEDAGVAKAMLQAYRNRSHQIVTGVAVICKSRGYGKSQSSVATAFFDSLDDDVIDAYITTGDPFDKAGAYAIQHPLIKPHIREIKGPIDAIVGLPIDLLADMLGELGISCNRNVDVDQEFAY